MRFYVICKSNPQERIYVSFDKKIIETRMDLPSQFYLTCKNGEKFPYSNKDVFAEVGFEPLGGALIGSLLFFIDPLIGLIGTILGATGSATKETAKVNKFNNS